MTVLVSKVDKSYHCIALQGNINFEDDSLGRSLRERGRRRIQSAVPAVPNSLDLETSRKIPQLPDPVPAVPGVFKEATKPAVVHSKIAFKPSYQKPLSLDINSQDARFRIGYALDSVRSKQSGFVRDSPHGTVIKNQPNSQTSGSWSNRGLVSFPNGALVPQDEPKVAEARAKILALLALEKNKALLAGEGQSNNHDLGLGPSYHNQATNTLRPNYPGKLNLNVELVSHPNGALVPVDEPAVAAARAKHLSAAPGQTRLVQHREHSEDLVGQGHDQERPSLVKHPNGAIVPVESQDVIDARAAHLAHHQNI